MVYVHLATGFEEVEALIPVDVLRRAGIEVKTVSVTGDRMVTGSHGIPVMADLLFEEVNYELGEMLLLPGGMPGTKHLMAHSGLANQILAYANSHKWVGAICAAPMVLANLGLLEGRTAVIFPGMEDQLKDSKLGTHRVEVDGKLITSKGVGTAMEFALTLVALLKGETLAAQLSQTMVVAS